VREADHSPPYSA